jgi:hypothetical protein
MSSNRNVDNEQLPQKSDNGSADRRDTFTGLLNASNAIQIEEERSRCLCDWDYATAHGTQRAHNPLCPVHDPQRAINAGAPQSELTRK